MKDKPNIIKVGDRVVVQGWTVPITVAKIYLEDPTGHETPFSETAGRVMLKLDWGPEFGESKVALHDENKTWFRYAVVN